MKFSISKYKIGEAGIFCAQGYEQSRILIEPQSFTKSEETLFKNEKLRLNLVKLNVLVTIVAKGKAKKARSHQESKRGIVDVDNSMTFG